MARCNVCFRHCELGEGQTGFCGARICVDGEVIASNYGRVTALALDPIEKKPLSRFMPGSMIISVGSYGCNLRCPFCQNFDISWSDNAFDYADKAEYIPPEKLAEIARRYRSQGNVGVAFTYNEPLIGYEYVLDAARLIHDQDMVNVLVTNGCISLGVLDKIGPYIDAMNIDLKGFNDDFYHKLLQGDRQMVMDFIRGAARICHVELTTLIIPGENDSVEEMEEISSWIASLDDENGNVIGDEIPLHISRFFPRFNMTDRAATDVDLIYSLAEVARKKLKYVYTGNC